MRAHLSIAFVTILAGTHCAGEVTDASSTEASTSGVDLSTTDRPDADGSSTTELSSSGDSTTSAGSTTEPEVFDHEGEHVVVITDSPLDPCGGTMAHMDDFVKRLSDRLGMPPPTGADRIRFTWVPDSKKVTELCGLPEIVAGCINNGQIYSSWLPMDHELVHAVATAVGHPPPFFTEGLAVSHAGYGGLPEPDHVFTYSDEETLSMAVLSSIELGNINDGYERAGRFAAYLVDRHGMDVYLELYAALPRDSDVEEINRKFEEVLGVSLLQSIAEFGPPWTDHHTNFDPQLSECSAPEVPWDGEVLTMDTFVYCSDERVIGPFDGHRVEQRHSIEIPADGLYELRIVGNEEEASAVPSLPGEYTPPFIGVSMVPCGAGLSGYMETQISGTARLRTLRAGRHSLRILGSRAAPWAFTFTLKRMPDP